MSGAKRQKKEKERREKRLIANGHCSAQPHSPGNTFCASDTRIERTYVGSATPQGPHPPSCTTSALSKFHDTQTYRAHMIEICLAFSTVYAHLAVTPASLVPTTPIPLELSFISCVRSVCEGFSAPSRAVGNVRPKFKLTPSFEFHLFMTRSLAKKQI